MSDRVLHIVSSSETNPAPDQFVRIYTVTGECPPARLWGQAFRWMAARAMPDVWYINLRMIEENTSNLPFDWPPSDRRRAIEQVRDSYALIEVV